MASKALWYVAKKRAELRDEAVAAPAAGELRVRARFGAVSRGTERLVFEGRVPESEFERMRAPFMAGAFPHPVKYGYSIVGTVEEGPQRGRTVFVLHPHQSEFVVPEAGSRGGAGQRAAAARGARRQHGDRAQRGLGRRARAGGSHRGRRRRCGRAPGCALVRPDAGHPRDGGRCVARRGASWRARSARASRRPTTAPENCDVVFHASASAAGLATALRIAGDEAAVVELSWYGSGDVAAPLGQAFHSRRLRLISSQVGKVAASHRPRWTYHQRLSAALALLDDPALDALLAPPVEFADLPERLPALLAVDADARCPLIRYP